MPHRRMLAAFAIAACVAAPALADDIPDLAKTPGLSRAGLAQQRICAIKWGADERHVTDGMKAQVFQLYGYTGYSDPRCVADAHGKTCEIDHLISRELGGADDVKNLWPQAYGTSPWNAHLKDKLENRLHVEMCAKRIKLTQARNMIRNDWRKAYVKYYGHP